MSKLQKKIWPVFQIKFGEMHIRDWGHAFKEVKELQYVWLYSLPHYEYDPLGIINNHYRTMSYVKIFTHQDPPFNEVFIAINNFQQDFNKGNLLDVEGRVKLQELREYF